MLVGALLKDPTSEFAGLISTLFCQSRTSSREVVNQFINDIIVAVKAINFKSAIIAKLMSSKP